MGLGRFGGGVGAVRYLCRQGARVTVTDCKPAEELTESLEALAGFDIERYCLGGHPECAFRDAELVIVNPAVTPDHPCLAWCRDNGILLSSEIALFCQLNPARTIGVTGSNGKSTTATLIDGMLRAAGMRSFLGGNIGVSLLEKLDEIRPDDWVVLELSSFQLANLDCIYFSPEIAVVTNMSPNHLDWHGSLECYRRAKQTVLRWQCPHGVAVLNGDDPETRDWPVNGRSVLFGECVGEKCGATLCPSTGRVHLRIGQEDRFLDCDITARFPGIHQQRNLLAACAAACIAGVPAEAMVAGIENFRSLPHRMEFLGEHHGRKFFDDSKATTPESAMAALDSFDDPVVLLAGGADKMIDLAPLAEKIAARTKAVALMGETAERMAGQIASFAGENGPEVLQAQSFDHAFGWAMDQSAPGEVVLLSPGCASYGWFSNYEERGRRFAEAVRNWPPPAAETPTST